jgi:nucleoside 2-deoxyribosyltransferase
MPTAFVSASYHDRDDLAPALDAITAALELCGVQPCIFIREYTFAPGDERAMMDATRRELNRADLLIAEVTHKAIGVGIEIGCAAALGKPVIYLRRAGSPYSTTVGGIASQAITYSGPDDLREQLAAALADMQSL